MQYSSEVRASSFVSSGLTNAGRALIWDWILGGSAERPPDEIFVGFATVMPTEADTGDSVVEVRKTYQKPPSEEGNVGNLAYYATGYERVAYPFARMELNDDSGWNAAGNGAYVNADDIVFPEVKEDWPLVQAWFLATHFVGGELFAYGPTGDLDVAAGDIVTIPAGSMTLQTIPVAY